VSVQTGEGTTEIIYGTSSIPAGAVTLGGYIARPDITGEWPTIVLFGPEPMPTPAVKDLCRRFARHGIAAVAPEMSASHAANRRIAEKVAAFVTKKDGGWSNARFGYGSVAFGPGIYDAAALAAGDGRAMAVAAVGCTIDEIVAEDLAVADIPVLFIGSRGDDTADIDRSVAAHEDLPQTTYVVYADAGERWWDVDAPQFDDGRATDTFDRLVGFFGEHLPARL
jgi:pimeloyl-ACP methyl ester carboxylesterase